MLPKQFHDSDVMEIWSYLENNISFFFVVARKRLTINCFLAYVFQRSLEHAVYRTDENKNTKLWEYILQINL